jgi:hypothetical protein
MNETEPTKEGRGKPLSGQFRNAPSDPRSIVVVKATTRAGTPNRTGLGGPSELQSGGHAQPNAGCRVECLAGRRHE